MYSLSTILRFFELVFGLRVKFHKSSFGVVGVERVVVERYASMLNCEVIYFPFTYLWLSIRVNPRTVEMWHLVINKFEKRLALWKHMQKCFIWGEGVFD